MAAKSKVISTEELITLAALIKQQHTQVAQLEDGLKANKLRLAQASMATFRTDLSQDAPDVFGNHEYPTDSGNVTVNIKVGSKAPMPVEINGRPAIETLRQFFGSETDSLFETEDKIEVTADEIIKRTQACNHPELFTLGLKPQLTTQEMMQLISALPNLVTVNVNNLSAYATAYPQSVQKTQMVVAKNGFVEALGKLSETTRKTAKALINALVPSMVTAVVNCGNTSKR